MPSYLLLILYSLFFLWLAYKNFRLAVGLFIISLPTYLIRFKIGPLPSTLLELMFGILFLVWLIKHARTDIPRITQHITRNKLFFISFFLFLVSSVISIFTSDMWYYSLGQWRAYFLEPMILFMVLVGRVSDVTPDNQLSSENKLKLETGNWKLGNTRQSPPNFQFLISNFITKKQLTIHSIIIFLGISTISISVFGIAQRFTGWHIGNVDWIALQTHRVTSFFLSPNAVGLFLGPVIPLMFFLITKYKKHRTIYYLLFTILLLAGLTLLLTKSLGALVAVGLGTLLFFFLLGYKKITLTITAIVIIISISLSPLLFISKSQSAANRLTLWKYSYSYLTTSPKNFIFGTGIRQFFRKIQKPYYDVKKMERLIYPHNIFLNFWTEIGLIGMLSFVTIYYLLFTIYYKVYKHSDKLLGASLLSALIVLLVHGLIDVPYFKNDLAMLFWILAAVVIARSETTKQSL